MVAQNALIEAREGDQTRAQVLNDIGTMLRSVHSGPSTVVVRHGLEKKVSILVEVRETSP